MSIVLHTARRTECAGPRVFILTNGASGGIMGILLYNVFFAAEGI